MRFIFFLLITFIFTACGHQKIRFSKVKRSQKVVEISEIPSLKKKSETAFIPATELEETQLENTSVSVETSESDQSVEENVIHDLEEGAASFPQTVQDSTEITEEEAAYITDEAIRAEKLGMWSLISSIAVPVLFLLGTLLFGFVLGFGPFSYILAGVLSISMLVFFVLSYVFGIASLRAPYNTARGRKFAVSGLIISSVLLGLILISFAVSFF